MRQCVLLTSGPELAQSYKVPLRSILSEKKDFLIFDEQIPLYKAGIGADHRDWGFVETINGERDKELDKVGERSRKSRVGHTLSTVPHPPWRLLNVIGRKVMKFHSNLLLPWLRTSNAYITDCH
jgi:hypothetical protein